MHFTLSLLICITYCTAGNLPRRPCSTALYKDFFYVHLDCVIGDEDIKKTAFSLSYANCYNAWCFCIVLVGVKCMPRGHCGAMVSSPTDDGHR
jgi:hypothetical protein